MFRYLIILVCLISASTVFAQQKPSSKTTEKEDDAKIDYQQIGAPIPPLKVYLFHDTSAAFRKKMPDGTATATTNNKKQSAKNRKLNEKQYLTENDVKNNANLLVMIFNPGCSHCEDETAVIQNNINLFDHSHLVMICKPASAVSLSDFYARRRVCDFDVMHIGVDSSDFTTKTFVFGMLPQINIYDHDRKLIKIYNGETPIDSLKQYIE